MAKGSRYHVGLHKERQAVDTDYQADKAWLLNIQRKLYMWSRNHPDAAWRDMWNWVTDPRNLRLAWLRIASNRGARSAGVDRVTVRRQKGRGEADPDPREEREIRTIYGSIVNIDCQDVIAGLEERRIEGEVLLIHGLPIIGGGLVMPDIVRRGNSPQPPSNAIPGVGGWNTRLLAVEPWIPRTPFGSGHSCEDPQGC